MNLGGTDQETAPPASPADYAYKPVGIVDRVDPPSSGGIRSYVWLDTDEDTVIVELTDDSAKQIKSGQQATFGCQSVGLSEVGTTSYSRNAKDYTDCVLDSVVDAKDADRNLRDHHDQVELGQSLDSMAEQSTQSENQ